MPTCYDPPMKTYRFTNCCPTQCRCSVLFAFPKVDEVTGVGLPGAVFELLRGGIPVATAVSSTLGIVRFPTPAPGAYTLVETEAPPGYQLKGRSYAVTVDAYGGISVDGQPVSSFRVPNSPLMEGTFRLIKYDTTSGVRLGGAEFELRRGTAIVGSGVTGADGTASFSGLPAGVYTLVETVPPAGYTPVTDGYLLVVEADGSVTVDGLPAQTILIGNTPVASEVFFTKVDSATGASLEGAEFELLFNADVIGKAASDSSGRVRFGNRPAGTYTLREVSPPAGYQPNTAVYPVIVGLDGAVTVNGLPAHKATIPNTPQPAAEDIFLRVQDAQTGVPVSGAVYQAFSGEAVISTATADALGMVNFGILPAGNYSVRELSPAPGYLPGEQTYALHVGADGVSTIDGVLLSSFAVKSARLAALAIQKTNTNGEPLGGAIFELSRNGTVVQTAATDMEGRAAINDLVPGTYTLTERTPPAGYEAESRIRTVLVDALGNAMIDGAPGGLVNVVNAPTAIQTAFQKSDLATGAALSGAGFQISSGTQVVGSAASDASGKVELTLPGPGTYTIQETEPPLGYLPNAAVYTLVADALGNVVIDGIAAESFTVPNTPSNTLEVQKLNTVGEPLRGAQFQLQQNGRPAITRTTDGTGRAAFSNLTDGVYTLAETVPPAGYQINEITHEVVVSGSMLTLNGSPLSGAYPVGNSPIPFQVFFTTMDAETGAPIVGAAFSLESGEGQVAVASSDAQGFVNFGTQPAGLYRVIRTNPAPGYQPNPAAYTVAVAEDGMVTMNGAPVDAALILNVPAYQLRVARLNNQGVPVHHAGFQLQSGDAVVGTAYTNAAGNAYFRGLTAGSYTLTEFAPALGYQPHPAAYTVVIAEDGAISVDGIVTDWLTVTGGLKPFFMAFTKRNGETGRPLGGAAFTLSSGGQTSSAVSDPVCGSVSFGMLEEGAYTLSESAVPAGFTPTSKTYSVVVSAEGVVTVDGIPVEGFSIDNIPRANA